MKTFLTYLFKRDEETLAVRAFPVPVPDRAVPLAMHALDADTASPLGEVDLPPGGTLIEFDYSAEGKRRVATWRVTDADTVVHEFGGATS